MRKEEFIDKQIEQLLNKGSDSYDLKVASEEIKKIMRNI